MSAAHDYTGSQVPLVVRKIPFSFLDKVKPHWNSQRPEWCHMVSGASLTMPYLEPFLIKTVLETVPLLTNKDLKEDARGFVGQESHYGTEYYPRLRRRNPHQQLFNQDHAR